MYRFLNRVWTLSQEYIEAEKQTTDKHNDTLRRLQHKTIRRVTEQLYDLNFNTAISALMEYTNELYKLKVDGFNDSAGRDATTALVQMIAPFAPHMADELWQQLGGDGLVQNARWPEWNDEYIAEDTITLAVQVNGKLRGEISVAADADEETVKAAALAHENVMKFLEYKQPTKVIYVRGRLVSVVV